MKTTFKPHKRFSVRAGFSLVELLVVIAVIGIIAAIAIPNIAGITGSAGSAKNLRNAQSVASVFSSARAAGWEPPATVTDELTAIDAIVTGVQATAGGTTMDFQVPMSATEVTALKGDTAAMAALTYDPATEQLTYSQ